VGKQQTKSGQNLRFVEVADTYNLREQALRHFIKINNPAYQALVTTMPPGTPPPTLQIALLEVDRDACLTLLAAIEAAFRLDYALRCERRDKQPLSRTFRNLFKTHEYYVSLEEVLLEQWKVHNPSIRQVIADLRAAFKYRHWLAHGRYWLPKLSVNVTTTNFYNLYTLAEQLDEIGLFM
jgi:hypothetical protein